MDERHAQIKEGAGLEESKLNVEFIDFLKRWSTPVLIVIAAIAVGYFLYQKRKEAKSEALSAAFVELEAARSAGSPAVLLSVAEDHAGQGAVAQIARLSAADIYLASYRSGIRPGAPLDPATGIPEDPEDVLSTDEARNQQLSTAEGLYQRVVDSTSGKVEMAQHSIGALFGLAAVAECKGDTAKAGTYLDQIESIARTADMPEFIELAKKRAQTLGTLADLPKLYTKAELPSTMFGNLPEGMTQIPNPFLNQAPATAPVDEGPVGPPAPVEPVTPPVLEEPETANPGAAPPKPEGSEPAEKPADKPNEKP